MSTNRQYPPAFAAAKLYRKQSKSGSTYFSGRWGGARIALLKSKDVADDGAEIWNLMLSEAPAKQDGRSSDYARSSSQAPERSVNHSTAAGGLRRGAGPG